MHVPLFVCLRMYVCDVRACVVVRCRSFTLAVPRGDKNTTARETLLFAIDRIFNDEWNSTLVPELCERDISLHVICICFSVRLKRHKQRKVDKKNISDCQILLAYLCIIYSPFIVIYSVLLNVTIYNIISVKLMCVDA